MPPAKKPVNKKEDKVVVSDGVSGYS